SRQTGPQRFEFIPQEAAGSALESVDYLGDGARRVGRDEEVNVVGHHLHRVDGESVLSGHGSDDRLEAGIKRRCRHQPCLTWGANEVILELKTAPEFCAYRGLVPPMRHYI